MNYVLIIVNIVSTGMNVSHVYVDTMASCSHILNETRSMMQDVSPNSIINMRCMSVKPLTPTPSLTPQRR